MRLNAHGKVDPLVDIHENGQSEEQRAATG